MKDVHLNRWQQIVIKQIEDYDDVVGTESMLSLSDYDRNKMASIVVKFSPRSGHSFLTAYIASKYPSMVVYADLNDWKGMLIDGNIIEGDLHAETIPISIYEISHDVSAAFVNPRLNLNKIKQKISSKRVIIIDNGTNMRETFPQVVDYIFQVATGVIVLLG